MAEHDKAWVRAYTVIKEAEKATFLEEDVFLQGGAQNAEALAMVVGPQGEGYVAGLKASSPSKVFVRKYDADLTDTSDAGLKLKLGWEAELAFEKTAANAAAYAMAFDPSPDGILPHHLLIAGHTGPDAYVRKHVANETELGSDVWTRVLGAAEPMTSGMDALPNPAAVNKGITITATVGTDPTVVPGTVVTAAKYTVDGREIFGGKVVHETEETGLQGIYGDEPVAVKATIELGIDTPGVYRICAFGERSIAGLTDFTDYKVYGQEECILRPVYDPTAGFVTGGGWIWSPKVAGVKYMEVEGKASFGFVSKYVKGATTPEGETEFVFRAGGLVFHSKVYAWLVRAGHKAQYKGIGTVNGAEGYGFMLTAIDGRLLPEKHGLFGTDRLRLKIWKKEADVVVYDNELGRGDDAEPTTVLGGGSIVIHTD